MSRSSLSGLSDRELLSCINRLVRREHETTLEILSHLNEVERRKLFLKLGYGSLFDYCTRHLKYSASAAGRRIQSARCIRRFPEVRERLEKNELNLSTVCLIAPVLTGQNKAELLGRTANRSQREVEALVAEYRPPVAFRDRVRPVRVAVPEPIVSGPVEEFSFASGHSRSGSAVNDRADGSRPSSSGRKTRTEDLPCAPEAREQAPPTGPRGPITPAAGVPPHTPKIEQRLLIQFLASETFTRKFEEARALLSNKLIPNASMEKVFEAVLEDFIDRHSPKKKAERRKKRQETARGKGREKRSQTPSTKRSERSRRILAAVRDKVFVKDKGQCTYVGSKGKRCGATHNLQVDHVKPFARGGTSTVSNLRLLCARHNRMEAERVYGSDMMKRSRKRE